MYKVLVETPEGGWHLLGEYEAGSTHGAMRKAAAPPADLDGKLVVAVPAKSWKPERLTIKPREPLLVIGEKAPTGEPAVEPTTEVIDAREETP